MVWRRLIIALIIIFFMIFFFNYCFQINWIVVGALGTFLGSSGDCPNLDRDWTSELMGVRRRPKEATGNHWRPERATTGIPAGRGRPWETTRDHRRPQQETVGMPAGRGVPWETTGDHRRPQRGTTGPMCGLVTHGRPQSETTCALLTQCSGDHGRPRETMGDHSGRSWDTTALDHRKNGRAWETMRDHERLCETKVGDHRNTGRVWETTGHHGRTWETAAGDHGNNVRH